MQRNPVAAVAVVEMGSGEDCAYLVLRRTERRDDPWSGQYAFPGGRREPEDTDLLATSIRETLEECGLELVPGNVVCALPMAVAGRSSGRQLSVLPWLFHLAARPVSFRLQATEIASAHWVLRRDLLNPARQVKDEVMPGLVMPGFLLDGKMLWGFTYGVLSRHLGIPYS